VKTISVKLSGPLASWLTRQSRELGRSQSDLVREALEQRRNGQGQANCHELLQDLCGSFKGPRDLSTNPRHLRGFGQ